MILIPTIIKAVEMSWNPNTDYWQLDPGWRQQGPSTTRVGTGSRSDAMVVMFSHLIWRHAAFAVARHHCGWRNTQCRQFVGISVHLQRVSAGLLRARRRIENFMNPLSWRCGSLLDWLDDWSDWLVDYFDDWFIDCGWVIQWLIDWFGYLVRTDLDLIV